MPGEYFHVVIHSLPYEITNIIVDKQGASQIYSYEEQGNSCVMQQKLLFY